MISEKLVGEFVPQAFYIPQTTAVFNASKAASCYRLKDLTMFRRRPDRKDKNEAEEITYDCPGVYLQVHFLCGGVVSLVNPPI